jgi:prepilin peptidase CpaA
MMPLAIITVLLGIACWRDIQTRRIPNTLVVVGLALGFLFQVAAPAGSGLFNPPNAGGLGLLSALAGGVVGLMLLMPLYLLRAMGAGDVKLLAMVGVWLGAAGVAWATVFTLLAGGVMSVAIMLATRSSRQVMGNLKAMLAPHLSAGHTNRMASGDGLLGSPRATTGRLPYAVAIAVGTAGQIARHWL